MLARNPRQAASGPSFEAGAEALTLLTIRGEHAKIEGKFQIADSLEIQCEIGGELDVGGKLVIGERGSVSANVRTVDAVIMGSYDGNMVATGNVEITATGRVSGNIQTDSLVISKGGFFNGNVTKISEDKPAVRIVEDPRAAALAKMQRP
ncbi:MAG: polymer-forming cytoskeletal protein [Gemmatimonadetes bacterium]|nr:polymer-forming cytoskeletal protein [Gemmatimonadota bacterium]